MEKRDWDATLPRKRIEAIARARAIPYLNTQGSFARAKSGRKQLYYNQDRHLTPAGNRVLAQTLFLEIKNKWMPQ